LVRHDNLPQLRQCYRRPAACQVHAEPGGFHHKDTKTPRDGLRNNRQGRQERQGPKISHENPKRDDTNSRFPTAIRFVRFVPSWLQCRF
jgi:hypothetical protein